MTEKDSFAKIFHLDEKHSLAVRPRDRMDALLDTADTKTAVQSLKPMEFYDLYHAVGPGDAMALLEYASPDQVRACLDLDVWRGDRLSDTELAPWVEQLVALPDEKFQELWDDLDPEILGLYLHRNIHLYVAEDRNDEVDIPDDESKNVAQTPDFTYWIAYPDDPDKADLLKRLVDKMYAALGIGKAWSALEDMHWELEATMEDEAYRFRTERIREYGFVPREEAAALFARLDVRAEADKIAAESRAELYVRDYSAPGRLDSALAAIDDTPVSKCYLGDILRLMPDTGAVRVQLLSLAQQIASYDGYQPHEEQGFDGAMLLAVSYASLGLEFASGRDDGVSLRILSHTTVRRLVTLGYNLTLELRDKAERLLMRGHLSIIEDSRMSLLTDAQRDVVSGLLEGRPRPYGSSQEPFWSLEGIRDAAAVIADIATRELFFGAALHKTKDDISLLAYTNSPVRGVENVNFDNITVTYLTRLYLGSESPWAMFEPDDLPRREDVLNAVTDDAMFRLLPGGLDANVTRSIRRFASQLAEQVADEWPEGVEIPDPRLIGIILITDDEE